jgi:Protein of unknown function (DUF2490)
LTNKLIFTTFTIMFLLCSATKAQTPPLLAQDDIQEWNEVQLTVPLSKKVDFSANAAFRFGKHISQFIDGRIHLGVIWHPNKTWSFQPFYSNIKLRDSRGRVRHEDRFSLRIGYKFPIKKFALLNRNMFEYRIRSTGNFWRYRTSLTVEKELPKKLKSKIFVTEEVFYDSISDKFSRNRLTVGINRTLTKKLSIDIFYMRQNDGNSRPGDFHVIGNTWKIKF